MHHVVVIPKQLAYQFNTFFIKKLQITLKCCVTTRFIHDYYDLVGKTNLVPQGNVIYRAANDSRICQ
jgi:hypothetical protein